MITKLNNKNNIDKIERIFKSIVIKKELNFA